MRGLLGRWQRAGTAYGHDMLPEPKRSRPDFRTLLESVEAAAPTEAAAPAATPSGELRVESVQQFEFVPLALFGVVSILSTLVVWPIIRRH